jgi:phenylalanyl-tRNA synthetase beta chain
MDAMSHLGVAKDVCAYLTYHHKNKTTVRSPFKTLNLLDSKSSVVNVEIKNTDACSRYSGLIIQNIIVGESPEWLKQHLLSIGQKPINNVVDVSNFILHETGQPIHIFDLAKIDGKKIIVTNANEGMSFVTLDSKERKLTSKDLVICNEREPMCIAGIYGGLNSGVTEKTTDIFIETACFDKKTIRKTAVFHDLRTESANRFEKGVDISNTINVLIRAGLLIQDIAGGKIDNHVIDIYPNPKKKTIIDFELNYLKKLSGKTYSSESVKSILLALDFEIINEKENFLTIAVPFSKSDVHIQADIVEEIMRIDGLDNVEIPATIQIAPATESLNRLAILREKIAQTFVGWGFYEIFTNSIINSAFFKE